MIIQDIVILSINKEQNKQAPDDGYNDGAIYVHHYLFTGDSCKLTWKIADYVKECPVDMFLYFIDKTFAVTDLNNDGQAEVWTMYKVSCQGDVSPVPMKIIMYEDNKKFAIQGRTRVRVSEKEFMGGDFSFDKAFKTGPTVFQQYAENLWKRHKTEDWKQ